MTEDEKASVIRNLWWSNRHKALDFQPGNTMRSNPGLVVFMGIVLGSAPWLILLGLALENYCK